MARGRSVIVGGGLGTVGTLGVGAILSIASVDPPSVEISSPTIAEATFARATHLIVGQSNQVLGTGRYTTSTPAGVVLIGHGAEIQSSGGTANSALVVGNGAVARATGGTMTSTTVVGQGANAITAGGILGATVFGSAASYIGGQAGVVIGANASGASQSNTVVGDGASIAAASSNSVAIGASSVVSGQRGTAIGDGAQCVGADLVSIGQGAVISGTPSRAINVGGTNTGGFSDSVTLLGTAFAANSCVIGGVGGNAITTLLVGKGNTSASPSALTFRLTNGIGSDIPGGDFTLQAGLGTSAGLPGSVNLNVGVQTGTGSTLQTSRTGVASRFSSVAADTYLMVFDVNGAALRRVTVGANDSGGAGFKVLRIPN